MDNEDSDFVSIEDVLRGNKSSEVNIEDFISNDTVSNTTDEIQPALKKSKR